MAANSIHDRPHMISEMEDYLRRISEINTVVAHIMEEIKTGNPSQSELPESPCLPADNKYITDYSKWDRFVEEEENAAEAKKKEEGVKEMEERVCREEATRSKEAGNKLFQESKFTEAHEAYSRAMALEPDNVVHPLNRALCNIRLENWAQGLEDCVAVLKVEPHNPKALTRRATILQRTDRFSEALDAWQKILKMNPRSREAKDNIPLCQQELEERARLDDFLAHDPGKVAGQLQTLLDRLLPAIEALLRDSPPCNPTELCNTQHSASNLTSTATEEANGANDMPSSGTQHMAHVLVNLGMLPALLQADGSLIYFRVKGGLLAVHRLLKHLIHTSQGSLSVPLLCEGIYSVLACALPNLFNLNTFVDTEKKSTQDLRSQNAILDHALMCVMQGEKAVAQAALNFLATVTTHLWVQQQLHLSLDAIKLCSFPTHNKSGISLALVVRIIDNCLCLDIWQEEFKKVDLVAFLMTFVTSEFASLRNNVVGCIMRLSTTEHFRHCLMCQDEGQFVHLPLLVSVLHSEIIQRGSSSAECRSVFVVEGLLSTFINCIVGDPANKENLCRTLHSSDIISKLINLINFYGSKIVNPEDAEDSAEDALPALCRSINLLAKAITVEDISSFIATYKFFFRLLVQLTNRYGLALADSSASSTSHEQYKEGVVEYCSVILGAITRAGGDPDVIATVYHDWTLMAGLLTHPNNNICGNAALTIANLAEHPGAAGPMGQSKVKVVDLLLQAIKTRRSESFQASDGRSFLHPKNTAANNKSCQMNCAIALAKLARDETNRDQLREKQGIEILHSVLQSK